MRTTRNRAATSPTAMPRSTSPYTAATMKTDNPSDCNVIPAWSAAAMKTEPATTPTTELPARAATMNPDKP